MCIATSESPLSMSCFDFRPFSPIDTLRLRRRFITAASEACGERSELSLVLFIVLFESAYFPLPLFLRPLSLHCSLTYA